MKISLKIVTRNKDKIEEEKKEYRGIKRKRNGGWEDNEKQNDRENWR
jgi:hypothetical protein